MIAFSAHSFFVGCLHWLIYCCWSKGWLGKCKQLYLGSHYNNARPITYHPECSKLRLFLGTCILIAVAIASTNSISNQRKSTASRCGLRFSCGDTSILCVRLTTVLISLYSHIPTHQTHTHLCHPTPHTI